MNPARILTVCMAAVLVAGGAALAAEPATGKTVAAAIEKLTGARTKFVWVRSAVAGKGVTDAAPGDFYQLMVFDTREAKERVLLPGPGSCANPLITGDGAHVVYSRLGGAGKVCVIDWDGANRKELVDGFAVGLWRDPASGVQWIYVGNNYSHNDNQATAGITRHRLDDPSVKELVWNKTQVEQRVFLSADGKRMGLGFPWNQEGVADLASGTWKEYGRGCNPCLAPDNSYRFFHMSPSHKDIYMYDDGGANRRLIATHGDATAGKGMFWNPKWSNDVRFFTICGPFNEFNSDVGSHPWLGEFNEDYTGVKQWIELDFGMSDNYDTYCTAWVDIDTGLGQHAGKAPYTLTVPSLVTGPGNWQWTFGDGSKGTEAKHTYDKAGTYTITATQGDRTLKGTVRVAERVGPKLVNAVALDDRRVFLTFSEPVMIEGAAVKLESGRAATKLHPEPLGLNFVAEFDQPLAAQETLVLEGITDLAQVPNAVANPRRPVQRPSWPTDMTGLLFLWENAKVENRLWDPVLGGVQNTVVYRVDTRNSAYFDRHGTAIAAGFDPGRGSMDRIRDGIHKTKQFSGEIVLASADLAQTKGPLIIVGWGWTSGHTGLYQEKDKLLVLLKKHDDGKLEVFEMATLPDTKPHHVIISWDEKRLVCYMDGKKVKEIDPSPATLLTQAGSSFAPNGWRGTFEHVAMYNRFIEEPEAAKNAAVVAAAMAKRKALPRIEVQATLVAKSTLPDPGAVAPYRNVLVVYEYQVEKVLNGTYAGKTIRVAQWGMRDLKPTPLAAQTPGTSVKLLLETFTDHDELEPELISDTLKENVEMKLYTNVNL